MSTNKKFRIQNGVDVTGELTVNDVVIIRADGTIVAGAIADAVSSLVDEGALTGSGSSIIDSDSQIFIDVNSNTVAIASETATRISDIANLQTQIDSLGVNADTQAEVDSLQSQIDSIVGASPETLDTLVEIVSAFEGADSDIQALLAANSSSLSANTAAIGVETTQRIAGDVTLQQNIDAEVTRATAAEQANAAAIAAEAATRGAAVSALQASQFTYNDSDGWTGNLIPSADNQYALGSPDRVWKDLYIGPGSLYINGTKILEDNSGTITMYADAGQNLSFGATGGGNIDLNAGDESVQMKSDLVMSVGETISTVGGAPTKFGGDVDMGTHQVTNVGTPVDPSDAATKEYVDGLNAQGTISGDKVFEDNVTIQGNLSVEGTTTTLDSQTLKVADNIIDLNSNVSTGVPVLNAGIRIMRGDEPAVQLRWNELEDRWEVYDGVTATPIAVTSTDVIAEGDEKLFFTVVRARDAVSQDIADAVAAEATARGAAIDAEIARATSAEAQLAADIVAEATARAEADSDEAAARIAGDATLQSAIDTEQAARIAADLSEAQTRAAAVSDLQAQLNTVTGSDLSSIQSQLDAIVGTSPETLDTIQEVVAAFEGADSDLTSLITGNSSTITAVNAALTQEVSNRTFFDAAEATARENADSDLQSAIDSLSATVSSNNAAKSSAISTETAARIAGDEGEAASREAAITAEATARVAGDATVQAAVDAEVARATAAEQANASAISAEETRALAAEADLQNQINQVEATGATHPLFSTLADLPDASANHGMFAHVHAESAAYFAHAGQWVKLANFSDLDGIDLSSIQSQIDAILGSSPESLDTLQEIVAAFESADGDLQTLMTANASTISTLDAFVKGVEGIVGPDVGLSNMSVNDVTITNGLTVQSHADGVKIIENGENLAVIPVTLEVGKTYALSTTTSEFLNPNNSGGKVGGASFFIMPASVRPNGGHVWDDKTHSEVFVADNSGNVSMEHVVHSTQSNTDTIGLVKSAMPYRYITPSVTDLHICIRPNMHGTIFNSIHIEEYSWAETLETSDQTVVGAINELHAEMADNSATSAAVQAETDARVAAISAEETARIAGDAVNANAIVSETNARAAAITAETQARISADNSLQTQIDAETAARESSITSQATLISAQSTALNTEISNRTSADAGLQTQIDDIVADNAARTASGATTAEVDAVQSNLDAEVVRAQLAEQTNASAIVTGDAALQAQLDAIVGTSPETLDTLQEIVTAYSNADSTLQGLIDANSGALQQLQTTIGADNVPLITPDIGETITYDVEYAGRQYYAVTDSTNVHVYDSVDPSTPVAKLYWSGYVIERMDANSEALFVRWNVNASYVYRYEWADLVVGITSSSKYYRPTEAGNTNVSAFAVSETHIYAHETNGTDAIWVQPLSESNTSGTSQTWAIDSINAYKMRVFGDKLYALRTSGADALWVWDIQSNGHLINAHQLTSSDLNSDQIAWGSGELTGSFEASSTLIAVGAPLDDTQGENRGSVYLFNPDNLNEAHTKLYAPAEYAIDHFQFGHSIALTDTRLIVGARDVYRDNPNISGSSGYIFIYDATNLSLPPLVIEPPTTGMSAFPWSMHEESNRLLVRSQNDVGLYVYDLTNMDQPPVHLVEPTNSTQSGHFGNRMAISPAATVTQTITDTIIPAQGLGNSINYLESQRQKLRADLDANLAAIQSNDADIASIAADVATNTASIATNAAAIVAVDADRAAFEASVNADRQSHRDAVQADIDQVNADRTAFEASVTADRQSFEDTVNASQAQFIADHDSDYSDFTSSVSGTFAETNLLQNEIRGRMGTGHIALPQETTSISYNKDVGDQYYTVVEGNDEFFVYTSAEYVENQSVQVGLGTRVVLPSTYNAQPEGNFITRDHVIVMARLANTSAVDREMYFLVYELATIDSSSLPIAEVHADLRVVNDFSAIRYDGGSKVLIGNLSSDTEVGSARIYDVPSLVAGNAIFIETTSEDLPTGVNYPTLGSSDYDGFACRVDWNDTHVFVGSNSGSDRIFVYDRIDLSYVTTLQDSIYGGGEVASNFVVSNTMIVAVQQSGGYYVHQANGKLMVWDASNLNASPMYFTDNTLINSSVYQRYSHSYYMYNASRKLAVSDNWVVFGSTQQVVMVTKDDLFNNNFPYSNNNYSWITDSFNWVEQTFKGTDNYSNYNLSNVNVYQFSPAAWGGITNRDDWDYPYSIQIQNDKLIITSRSMRMTGGTSEDSGTVYIHDLNNFTDLVNGVEGVDLHHPVMIEESGFTSGAKLPAVSATGTVTQSVTETFNPNDSLTAAVNYLNAKKEELLTAVEAVTGSSTLVQDLQTIESNIDFKLLAQDQRFDSDKAEQTAIYDAANAEQTAIYAAANAEQASIYDSANAAHVAYFEQYTSGETLSRQNADNNLQTQITSNDGDIASLQSQIDTIVGTSPETLDTLQELVSAYENADHDLQTLISGNDSDIQSIKDIISQTKAPKYYQTEHGMVSFGGGSSTVSASGYSTTSLYFTNSQSYATIPNTVANNINGYPVYALEILNGENVMYRIESPTRITLGSGGAQFSSGYWNTMTVPLHTNTGAQQIINHTGTWGSDYNIIPSNTISPAPGGRAYDEHLTGNNYSFDAIRFYGSNGSLLTEYDLRSTRTGSAVLENGQVVSSDYNELDTTVGTTAKTIYGAINELHSEIGNSTLSTSSQTLSGAINELKSDLDPLSNPALETAATDVVGAINELNTSLQSITGSDTQFLDDIATNQTNIAGHDSDFVDVRGRLDVIEDTSVPNLQAQIDVHSGQIATEVSNRTSGDAALQAQIDNIVGTSPETLDTLQEVVATFQNADNDLQALITGNTSIVSTHTTQIATLDDQIHGGAGLNVPNMPTQVSRYVYQDQYIVATSGQEVMVFDANSPLSAPTVISILDYADLIKSATTGYFHDNGDQFNTVKVVRDKLVLGFQNASLSSANSNTILNNSYIHGAAHGIALIFDLNDLSGTPVVKATPSLMNMTSYNQYELGLRGYGRFGNKVAGSEDYIIIAARYHDNSSDRNRDDGRVYLYNINDLSLDPVILSSPSTDNQPSHNFGSLLHVDGSDLFIGARDYDSTSGYSGDRGIVYKYNLDNLLESPQTVSPYNFFGLMHDAYENTGYGANGEMASNSTILAVAAPYAQSYNVGGIPADYYQGEVYLHPKSSMDKALRLEMPSSYAQQFAYFGTSIAMNDNYLYVSATGYDHNTLGNDLGLVFVYDVNDFDFDAVGSTWGQTTISPTPVTVMSSYDGQGGDYYGHKVRVNGGKVIISSRYDDDVSSNSGSIYIYDENALTGIPIKISEAFASIDTSQLGSDMDITAATGAVEIVETIIPSAGLSEGINYLESKTNELSNQITNIDNTGALLAASNAARLDAVEVSNVELNAKADLALSNVISGDSDLQTQIDNLTIAASGDVSLESAARIAGDSDEAAARVAGDATVQAAVDAEVARATGVESGLQSQLDAIVGTSPETLDTLQEVVAAFEGADGDLQTLITTNTSEIATLSAFVDGVSSSGPSTVTYGVVQDNNIDPAWKNQDGHSWTGSNVGYGHGIDMHMSSDSKAYIDLPAGSHSFTYSSIGASGIGVSFFVIPQAGDPNGNLVSQAIVKNENTLEISTWEYTVDEPVKLVVTIPILSDATGNRYRTFNNMSIEVTNAVSTLETTAQTVTTAINEVHSELDAEVLRAQTAEGAEEVRALAAEAVLQSNINTESSARLAGDAGLQSQIDALSGTQTSDKSGLEVSIANETARATAAENTLQSNIDAESTRAQTAEAANAAAVVTEKTRAEAVEAGLAADIAVETARATAAEAQLANHLGANFTDGSITVDGLATFNGGLYFGDGTGTIGFNANVDHIQSLSDLDMMSNSVINVAAPVDSADAANKAYVDATTQVVSDRVDAILNGAGESLDTIVEVVAAFENADSDIQALITSNSASVTANTNAINAEVAARQQAIIDEATARANADSDLSAGLSNETSRALSAEGVLTSDLAAEVARATSAETGLAADIAAEASRATAAEGVNATAISAETTRATTVEASLAQDIADEALRAQGAEAVLTSDVSANATAISNLQSQVAGVSTSSGSSTIEMTAEVDMSGNKITGMADPTAAQDAATKSYVDASVATEATARTTEDSSLQSNIDAANARIDAILNGSTESLDTVVEVVSAFEGADSDIQNLITANASTISQNAAAIAAETTARANADSDESALRAAADAVLTADLAAEVARAQAAEAAETSARVAADSDLQTQIDFIKENTDPSALDSLTELVSAFQDADSDVTSMVASNASAIAETNARTAGISVDSDSNIEMSVNLEMGQNNIRDVNDVYAARGFIDTIESGSLTVQTGTVDFAGSTVNFGSSQITGSGFGQATKQEIDQHLNQSAAGTNEFLKWNGSDYEFTDYIQGQLATNMITVEGTLKTEQPGSTIDWQDGLVHFGGSQVIVDEPTSPTLAANKRYVDEADSDLNASLSTAIANEESRATTAEGVLTTNLTNEISRATSAEAALASDISAEETRALAAEAAEAGARADADSDLQSAIDAEVARATAAEAVNAQAVVDEATARATADTTLQSNIDTVSGRVDAILNGSSESLDTIVEVVAAFENADSDLQTLISSNAGSHTANAAAITAEETRATNAEAALQSAIDAEETRATGVEADLQSQITSEIASRSAADQSMKDDLDSDIAAEAALRSAGDATLQSAIDVEVARATAAEGVLQSLLDSEQSARILSDQGLQSAITAEENARIAADAVLQSAIDAEELARTSADNTLQANIDAVDAAVTAITNGSPETLNQLVEVVAAFEDADSDLQTLITNLGGDASALTARVATLEGEMDATELATTSNANAISAETAARVAAVQVNADAITAEATTRASAITAEQNARAAAIAASESDRDSADADLQAQITALSTTEQTSKSSLQALLNQEIADRTAGDSDLTDSLAAEVARATAAESALSSDISDESSARATADASLQTQINNILSNTDATALNSLAEIVAEFQSVDGTLTGLINSNGSRITALESSVGTIEAWNTDNVSEGTTNLYFTDARVKACLTGGLCIDYDSTTGEIAIDEVEAASSLTVAESHDANALGGEAPSYYRINVYDAAGNLVN